MTALLDTRPDAAPAPGRTAATAPTSARVPGGGVTATGACDGSVDRDAVMAALATVEDPELPVTVVDLGLVRRLAITDGEVYVGMTWTSLACPCTEMIREEVHDTVAAVEGVTSVTVDDVLEPWSRDDITPVGRELLRAVAVI